MESPNLKPLTNSNYATAMAGSTAQEVVRTRVWQSVTAVETDAELLPYLQQTFVEVAGRYHKGLTDFSIGDVKRAVDATYGVMSKFALEKVTLTQFQRFSKIASVAVDIANLVSFSMAVANLVSGKLGWLVWHVSKNVAAPRVKRAAAVYIAGNLAVVLYGGSASEITFKPTGLDPIFDSMDRGTLMLLSTHLQVHKIEKLSNVELISEISQRLATEGKNQSIWRAWFPKDAASYVEVLVAVSKAAEIDIKGLWRVEEIEGAICTSLFEGIWQRLTPAQRRELSGKLESEFTAITGAHIASAAALGTIGAAQLSGFGVYAAASTVLGFLSSSLGISLPFAAYTGLSTTIATVIGPLGVVPAAFLAVFEFLRAKPEGLLGPIVVIAAWRSHLSAEGQIGSTNSKTNRATPRITCSMALMLIVGALVAGLAAGLVFSRLYY